MSGTRIHTALVTEVARHTRYRYYSGKLEGMSDVAIFEELVRSILETYEEFLSKGEKDEKESPRGA